MTEVMELADKELKTSVVNHIGIFDNAFVWFFDLVVACGILVPWPGIKPGSLAMEPQSPNHWTTREVLIFDNIKENISMMRLDMKDLILKRTRDLDYNIVASTCLLFDPRQWPPVSGLMTFLLILFSSKSLFHPINSVVEIFTSPALFPSHLCLVYGKSPIVVTNLFLP